MKKIIILNIIASLQIFVWPLMFSTAKMGLETPVAQVSLLPQIFYWFVVLYPFFVAICVVVSLVTKSKKWAIMGFLPIVIYCILWVKGFIDQYYYYNTF